MNAYHREMEVYQYQINIDNYTTMMAAMSSDAWPETLSAWASTEIANLPATMSDEDVELISDLQYRDRIRSLIRTEKAEQNKARRVLEALKQQIGADADVRIAAYTPTTGA